MAELTRKCHSCCDYDSWYDACLRPLERFVQYPEDWRDCDRKEDEKQKQRLVVRQKLLGMISFIIGMIIYFFIFENGNYDNQNFFNIIIIFLQCFILLKIDKINNNEKEIRKTDIIINAIIGAIFAFMINSLRK